MPEGGAERAGGQREREKGKEKEGRGNVMKYHTQTKNESEYIMNEQDVE